MNAYIHIPFCASHCSYCDFTSYIGDEKSREDFLKAVRSEIAASDLKGPLRTVYFGGGTPSWLPPGDLEKILAVLRTKAAFAPGLEISMEANPESAEAHKLGALRRLGVNRLSLGAQAFQEGLLRTLGRRHDWQSVRTAVVSAREAGFANLNLDLMFGLPGQGLVEWEETLERALELSPDHLSIYALQLEEGTPITRQVQKGLPVPLDDEQADQYGLAQERLEAAGFEQYEVSNFARNGRECLHHQAVWRGEDYWGFGVSAVGTVAGKRRTNPERLEEYLQTAEGNGPVALENLDERTRSLERILLGLRTREGVSQEALREAGADLQVAEKLLIRGLLSRREGRWAPTSRGYFVLNGVLARLLNGSESPQIPGSTR